MKLIIKENNTQKYATALKFDPKSGKLTWLKSTGTNVILFELPYAAGFDEYKEEIIQGFEKIKSIGSEYIPLPGTDDIYACVLNPKQQTQNKDWPIHNLGKTYFIAPLERNQETDCLTVLLPKHKAKASLAQVNLSISPMVLEDTVSKRRLFKKVSEPSGYYRIDLDPNHENIKKSLKSGDLEIQADGFRFPVTRELLEQNVFFVKADTPPVIQSVKDGLEIHTQEYGFEFQS